MPGQTAGENAARAANEIALATDVEPARPAARGMTRARWAAYGYATVAAVTLGWFLLGLPIQVSDSFGEIVNLSASWSDLVGAELTQRAYLRPLMTAEMKLVYDLSGGNYHAWFRGTHAVQAAMLIALFMTLVKPRTWTDTAVVPLGLGVLLGLHTFAGTVREAFPINTYLTLLLCCFAAAAIAFSRYRWWNDVALAVLFVLAALTVESGLLVWVIAAGAALLGAPGVSRRGALAVTMLLAAYFYLRFVVLAVGSPDLLERSSGFGFGILEPDELMARFGDDPTIFYAYNIVTSAVSVLLSEPTGGVFAATRSAIDGTMAPPGAANLLSSAGVCAVLVAYGWSRRREWRRWDLDRRDRLVMLFVLVLVANAVISYPYTKDVIMSPAGAFLAVAVCAAASGLAERQARALTPRAAGLAALLVAAVALAWAFRVESLYTGLRQAAVAERVSWAYVDSEVARGEVKVETDHARAMLRRLQHDALVAHPAPLPLRLPLGRLAETDD
jgi:hypothetical protein